MARVEIEHQGIKGVLIYGCFPGSFSFYKDIDWKSARKEKFLLSDDVQRDLHKNIYHRFMGRRVEPPKPGPRSNLYRKMKEMLEDGFCDYEKQPCAQFQFPVIGVARMGKVVTGISGKKKEIRDIVVPAFTTEIEHDLAAGRDTYVFHLAFLDLNPDNYCPSFEECTKNWMEFMGFTPKEEEDYLNFEVYRNAAEILLKEDIERHHWFDK